MIRMVIMVELRSALCRVGTTKVKVILTSSVEVLQNTSEHYTLESERKSAIAHKGWNQVSFLMSWNDQSKGGTYFINGGSGKHVWMLSIGKWEECVILSFSQVG